jgi:PleD family two-component response regulator
MIFTVVDARTEWIRRRAATSLGEMWGEEQMTDLERFADAHVFVIDDNATNIELLKALLLRAGVRNVSSSTDPREP